MLGAPSAARQSWPEKAPRRTLSSPLADWQLCHVAQLCQRLGLVFAPPQAAGAHGTVSHPRHPSILTVPAGRVVQPVLIRAVIALALASGGPDGPHDYQVVLRPLRPEEGRGFLATVAELPGCMSDGATIEEATANVADAVAQWVAQAKALDRPVPWPRLRLLDSTENPPSVSTGAAPVSQTSDCGSRLSQ